MRPGAPLLTATVLARNHVRFVETCLASVRPFADEIVVIDLDSTDGTGTAARAAGARVVRGMDAADIAGARNRGLDEARGVWALVLDADEVAHPVPPPALREALSATTAVVGHVEVHPHPGATPYRAPRLLRRQPGLRFHGPVNPTIEPALAALDGRVVPSPLVVERRGYGRQQETPPAVELLRRLLALGPVRVVDWCHLARIHLSRGETAEAGRAWERAVAAARARPRAHPADGLAYAGLVRWRLDHGQDVTTLLAEARQAFPCDPELTWLAGSVAMRAGKLDQAVVLFETLLAAGGPPSCARALPYDARLFALGPHAALAQCRFRQGRHAESLEHFEAAAALDPWCDEYRVKAHLAAARAGRRATVALPSPAAPRPHVFVHIPKTAGLAVNDILWRNERPGQLARYWGDVPDRDLPRLATVGTISGHFTWGLHARLGRPCTYVTFLRDPLERLLSHYAYHRDQPRDPCHPIAMASSLPEWADRVVHAQNVHVQYIAGRRGSPTAETLKTAQRNLRSFAVVGLTGRFDESVVLMAHRLGLARPYVRWVNEGRKRLDPEELPRSVRAALEKHVALDRELYALAEEIVAARLAAAGPRLSTDLAALRGWLAPSLVEPPPGAHA